MNKQDKTFLHTLWAYYDQHARIMPWRNPEADGSFDFYKILVSEMMLQQTQVQRVVPKFQTFVRTFPAIPDLAQATLEQVLQNWQGLGYNRRAKYLHDAAKYVYAHGVPATASELATQKGIGKNTAAAVFTYTYNIPELFIETNIRTVYIHHCFPGVMDVHDDRLLEVLRRTIDANRPREFYWALMDYGSYLKKTGIKTHAQSKHYNKQSAFHGSVRQLRGEILRQAHSRLPVEELLQILNDSRSRKVLEALETEGLIECRNNVVQIASS